MPCTDRVEMDTAGGDEGIHGGAAAEELRPAEPEAAAPEAATTKRVMSGIEVLDSVSNSMSEMSLLSMLLAAAAQGLPMLNRWTPPAKEPTITMWVSRPMPKVVMSKVMMSKVWLW